MLKLPLFLLFLFFVLIGCGYGMTAEEREAVRRWDAAEAPVREKYPDYADVVDKGLIPAINANDERAQFLMAEFRKNGATPEAAYKVGQMLRRMNEFEQEKPTVTSKKNSSKFNAVDYYNELMRASNSRYHSSKQGLANSKRSKELVKTLNFENNSKTHGLNFSIKVPEIVAGNEINFGSYMFAYRNEIFGIRIAVGTMKKLTSDFSDCADDYIRMMHMCSGAEYQYKVKTKQDSLTFVVFSDECYIRDESTLDYLYGIITEEMHRNALKDLAPRDLGGIFAKALDKSQSLKEDKKYCYNLSFYTRKDHYSVEIEFRSIASSPELSEFIMEDWEDTFIKIVESFSILKQNDSKNIELHEALENRNDAFNAQELNYSQENVSNRNSFSTRNESYTSTDFQSTFQTERKSDFLWKSLTESDYDEPEQSLFRPYRRSSFQWNTTAADSDFGTGITTSFRPNAYGLGVGSDQFGRPFRWQVINEPNADTSLLQVKPNAYGLGVGSDQFGRPVRAVTWP